MKMDSSEKQPAEDNFQGDPTGKQKASGETESSNVQPPPENNTTSQSAGAQEAHTQAEDPSQDKAQAPAASEQVQQQPGGSSDVVEEEEERMGMKKLSEDMYYNYDELYSRPVITADSEIPENLLHLTHSFGYDCGRRANLQLLDERTLAFVAGNQLIFLDVRTKEQRYLRSCSGGGIGTIMAHPSNRYFAVAEKGDQPNIVIYEYPSLRLYRILRGGTGQAYSFVDFNHEGTLLASVGSAPDYMLTLWEWRHEQVMLRCKAFSQDVYRVTFSPDNPGQLTTSGSGHIKFWKMASTFTGLKLQGLLGRFGKTALTDIEGYVELPDGKVVSGSEWGNMLLWDGGLIKVEICRKGGRTCHAGTIQQFALDEGELMTIGSDGAIRGWDFESIDTADCNDDSGLFEIEPMNEMVIGRNVSLSSMVKSCLPDSFIWFAQDSNGGIWKLDLSFSNITQDPECLFSFHAGVIQGMDVSSTSHLMATTTLDRSVRIFDFLAKKELTTSRYKQGGTTLTWAPRLVNPSGGLVVVGFEDGVVRLLELYNPQSLRVVAGRSRYGDAELRLKQAFKPHNAAVTAIAYERNGEILATGSMDCTVFFFTVGDRYDPIGFVTVPGPVQGLEWSPQSHGKNTLLVLCRSGHVVEVQSPDPEAQNHGTTYQISGLPTRNFTFSSIKSHIKREEEIARRQALKEKKQKEREAQLKKAKEEGLEPTEEELQEVEEEEELPPLYTPDPPSPLCCGFYSLPGAFWLSMGGYDSGFLYHCKFSEQQGEDLLQRRDEPFTFLPVQNTDEDPICTITFSVSIHERKTQMNSCIMALRDTKVSLVSRLRSQAQQLQAVQERLAPHFCSPAPTLPSLLPEETPETKLRYTRTTLQRYGALRAQRACTRGQELEGGQTLLEQLEAEIEKQEETPCHTPADRREREVEESGVTELEEEMREVEEIRLLYEEESLLEQMSSSMWQFDAELCLLRHEKLWLDIQMKLADLRHVTLFQELLLLKEFEKRENSLQERLNACVEEEEDLRSKLEECKQALELKRRDISKLQERERAIAATFQASLGENNKFADFLTRVFKKKIKRVKKKEKARDDEEQEDSDEDSDEESDWDEDEDDSGSESGGPLDDSVCPPNCNSELFENTVQLRERRLDLEELLVEEKKTADNLRKECDSLVKKEKVVHGSLKAAEGDLELFNREKQQKLNELDVVVPLRLHQIEFVSNGVVPCSLAPALVLNTVALGGLQERIKELQVEKSEQRDLYRQARQQHVQLIHDRKDMEAKIQSLEARCEQLMLMKFGKLVDLEALQTLSGNRNLEEMRQDSRVREAAYTQEVRQWEVKVTEARHAVTEVTRHHTERLLSMNSLLSQKKEMEDKLNTRQSRMGTQFQGRRHAEEDERRRLYQLVQSQAQEANALRQEINILSRKGGHILPPSQAPLPPLPKAPSRSTRTNPERLNRPFKLGGGHPSTSSQGVE
ncbi:cilia- and flagella-associated protein 44 [Oncorhynchus nerka]|uniref:cilia- and flagella-associated protein 44 n=1 Tax=Oncorhynchus nerka TaxID=8023 RepID=UPI0031B8A1A9